MCRSLGFSERRFASECQTTVCQATVFPFIQQVLFLPNMDDLVCLTPSHYSCRQQPLLTAQRKAEDARSRVTRSAWSWTRLTVRLQVLASTQKHIIPEHHKTCPMLHNPVSSPRSRPAPPWSHPWPEAQISYSRCCYAYSIDDSATASA